MSCFLYRILQHNNIIKYLFDIGQKHLLCDGSYGLLHVRILTKTIHVLYIQRCSCVLDHFLDHLVHNNMRERLRIQHIGIRSLLYNTESLPNLENPNWPQTTLASAEFQELSQIVPQTLLMHTSTRPRPKTVLSSKRTSPF